jgi:rubrerythrin
MRRKPPIPEPVIDTKLLESARQTLQTDKATGVSKCVVCGSSCAPNSTEGLCWVCRRLKISAWRDSDQQAVQE